jgi:BioD-like phosphotransacetylase family protein
MEQPMATIFVTSAEAGAGKTGVAAAIARHYAYEGKSVRLFRLEAEAALNAPADAAYYAGLDFAPGSPDAPVVASAVTTDCDLVVVEGSTAQVADFPGALVVAVGRGASAGVPSGVTATALVRTDVPLTSKAGAASVPVASLLEDRTLAGFSVDEAQALLRADVLVEGDLPHETCDHLVIAPISSDAGQPHFRRFQSKAVVVRFDKTDQHLAAMKSGPSCLILTGGRRPSDYLFDAATASGVPVLLSRTDTENTVIALESVFDKTRFVGERKLNRMSDMLEASALFEALTV